MREKSKTCLNPNGVSQGEKLPFWRLTTKLLEDSVEECWAVVEFRDYLAPCTMVSELHSLAISLPESKTHL